MFKCAFFSGRVKELCIYTIILVSYSSLGISRSYTSFLFHQLSQNDSKIVLSNDEKTWIASSIGFISPFGSLFGGILADLAGRKNCMFFTCVPFLISWAIIIFATNFIMLFTAEIITSFGLGMVGNASCYLSELATASTRGILAACFVFSVNFGVILCNSLMYFFKWNEVAVMLFVFYIVNVLITCILPESPAWLYSRGKTEKAVRNLCSLRNTTEDKLKEEIEELEKCSSQKETKSTNFVGTVVNCSRAWKQLLMALGLFVLVMQAGYFVILPYTILILDHLELPFNSGKIALSYSITGFASGFVAPFFIHNFRRRTMFAVSSLGMTLAMLVIAVYEEMFLGETTKPCVWIVPVVFCSFMFFCNIGVLPIFLIFGAEIFPLEVRGVMVGVFGFVMYMYWTFILKAYPLILFNFGIKALIWVFFGNSVLLALFGVFVLPETKGKTSSQIQEEYFGRKKVDVEQS